MAAQWTADQVLALAPDPASAKNGRSLASSRKWASLSTYQQVIWGECQGSGKNPYRTQIDLNEPAFRCSCPSRKFPCKHGLGLFLLLAEQSALFNETEPPAWVAEWLAARTQRLEKQLEKQTEKAEKAKSVDPNAQAKRIAERQRKVTAGIQDLRRWLEDQIRQGLVTVQQESYQFWDAPAARLVDAQAPGLARQLRELVHIVHANGSWNSPENYTERLLERLGRLYLVLEGFEHWDTLPPEVQADIHTQIGWPVTQETVLAQTGQADLWLVVGQQTQEEDRLKARRIWLLGLGSQKAALLLDFAHGRQPFEHSFLLGTCFEAELVFYPGAYPLRALIKTRQDAALISKDPPGQTIGEAIAAYSSALVASPWLERFPLLLQAVLPIHTTENWLLQDSAGSVLPITPRLDATCCWQLLALSGGQPLTVFGEWNGTEFLPLSVWTEGRFYGFGD